MTRAPLVGALALALSSCGSPTPPRMDTGPVTLVATNASPSVFEGMRAATTFLSAPGVDFTGATVTAEDGGLIVREQRCGLDGCAVVVEVADVEPDVGRSVPSPIDATNRYLRIQRAGSDDHRALFSVLPLDAIRNAGDTATVRGTYFAASMTSVEATIFRGAMGQEPVRWFVFGDATLRGLVDVSATMAGPGPGGGEGAALGAASGPGAGGAGSATAGAGGGGSAEPGVGGQGAGGGAGGSAFGAGCATDPFDLDCGGGGGGAADGAGGHGGGTFMLVVLGTLDADAEVRADGGDASSGGGGGGAGRVAVSGSARTGAGVRASADGGAGGSRAGAAGGAGGGGDLDLDATARVTSAGPWITADSTWTVEGTAAPDAMVRVESLDGIVLATGAAAGGTFAISVPLMAGLNRLRVVVTDGAGPRRTWQGNHFELERRGTSVLPIGALLDVVHLP